MKSAREIKLCSQPDLPTELLLEILIRLPVKSLLRFRCVLKSWKSLIDDPEFCGLHLKTFKNNCDETHLFVVQAGRYLVDRQDYTVRISHTFRTPKRVDYLGNLNASFQTLATSDYKGWSALCSLDGLVMVEHLTTPELVLWNPSNKRARILTPSPTISEGMINLDLGFGYNPLLKDYQHVRFVQGGKSSLHSVAIYTVKPGLWKTKSFLGKGIGDWIWSFYNYKSRWKTVCLRGVIYFTPQKRLCVPPELVAFDLRDEVFAFTNLPPAMGDHLVRDGSANYGYGRSTNLLLLDDGSSLGVICYVPSEGCIWVMETLADDIVSKCWAKRYTFTSGIQIRDSKSFDARNLFYKHLKKNGEVILMYNKQVTSYNLETQEEKILLANGGGHCKDVWSYKESMFML